MRLLPKNNSPLDICLGSCIMDFVELIKKRNLKGYRMSNITIAMKSEIATKRAELKALVASYKEAKVAEKEARAVASEVKKIAKENKAFDRAAKKADRIAKLEAKLASLKNPVGTAARKAAKKPSNVTVMKMAA